MPQITEILAYLKSENIPFSFEGTETESVELFSSLAHYKPDSFTWVKNPDSIPERFDLSQVKLAFISEDVFGNFQNAIRTNQSKKAFFAVIEHFYGQEEELPSIGQFTYISPKVKLGKNVRIGHNCTLDGDITIGDNTVIWNNVVLLSRVAIGQDCDIRSGTVIGGAGYAYTEDENRVKTMIRHFGGVQIGDNVFIGEGCNIHRGTIDDTIISRGVKIDGHCFLAHNTHIEENVNIQAGTTLYGSVHVGEGAHIATSTVRNQVKIGPFATVGMGSVVVKNVPASQTVVGNPAKPFVKKG